MNANVVSGGRERGRSDEASLPEDLMSHTMNETVYLGRASFRITHELEAVDAEEPTRDSSPWFSHESVILEGGPSGLAVRQKFDEQQDEAVVAARPPGIRRAWLLVALPVAAFALGIAVASAAASRSRRSPTVVVAPAAAATAPAMMATVVPVPAIAPTTGAATVSPPAVTPPPATLPPIAALPASAVAATAAPAAPREVERAQVAAPAPDARTAPVAAPRAAAKPHVVRKPKAEHVKSSEPASDDAIGAAAGVETTAPAATPKKAVKWVDPWAN